MQFFNLKEVSAKTIAYLGVLTALSTITNILTIPVIQNVFVISFNHTISFMIGALFGPIAGTITGALGDILGHLISPKGAYNFLITLSSAIPGLFSGIAFTIYFKFIKNKNAIKFIAFTVISYVFITLIATCGLNTFALWSMYSKGKTEFFAYLGIRAPYQLIVSFINIVISCIIPFLLKNSLFSKYFTQTKEIKNLE